MPVGVLTWKNVGTEKFPETRLCALGFQDLRLTTLPTSSPTLTSDGEPAILEWSVIEGHLLESGDSKTAFLSSDPDPAYKGSDALCFDPPSDLKSWLNLGSEDVLGLGRALWSHDCTTSLAPEAQRSPSTSWFCFVADGPVCLDSAEISLLRNVCRGFGLSLSLEPEIKVDFDVVVAN